MPDYISWLRARVGPEPLMLNFAAACIVESDKVLLQLRGDDGRWGFAGGALELGESAEDAVVREAREETGLVIEVEDLLGVYSKYTHTYPNGDVAQPVTVFFRARAVGGHLGAGSESWAVRWFPIDDVPPLMSRQHEDALADLRAGRHGIYR